MKLELSDRAERDLKVMRRWMRREGLDPRSFLDDLVSKAEQIAELGLQSASRPGLPPDVRAFPYKRRLLCYRIEGDVVRLVRFLHQSQNYGPEDFD